MSSSSTNDGQGLHSSLGIYQSISAKESSSAGRQENPGIIEALLEACSCLRKMPQNSLAKPDLQPAVFG